MIIFLVKKNHSFESVFFKLKNILSLSYREDTWNPLLLAIIYEPNITLFKRSHF